jgi:hypothetical protein
VAAQSSLQRTAGTAHLQNRGDSIPEAQMVTHTQDRKILDPRAADFYRHALKLLADAKISFLLGGAYAFHQYTGIARHTKDLDIFIRKADVERTFALFVADGFQTELTYPHWLGKAYCGEYFIDLIFSSMNGVEPVDEAWFDHATTAEVLGARVQICPAEEMIWQKAFIMERERYDGADVAHLLRARGRDLNWPRLLDRFGPRWPVLLSHLIIATFIYPGDRPIVPDAVMRDLLAKMQGELAPAPGVDRLCQGTLLSLQQYAIDTEEWGYKDARLAEGFLSPHELTQMMDSFTREKAEQEAHPLVMSPICDHDEPIELT